MPIMLASAGNPLGIYKICVILVILGLTALCIYASGKYFRIYRATKEHRLKKNAIFSLVGAVMCLCFLLSLLTLRAIFFEIAVFIVFGMMFFSVGNGVRNQLDEIDRDKG